jgi:hypothetical protein
MTKIRPHNFSNLSSAAAVVFGGQLSARSFGYTKARSASADLQSALLSPGFEILF